MPSLKSRIYPTLAMFILASAALALDVKSLSKLHSAILGDDTNAVARLIKADPTLINATIDATNRKPSSTDGFTSLHYAIHFDRKAIAELLINNGADINVSVAGPHPSFKGMTPLHLAAEDGSEQLAKLLVDHKADINGKTAFPELTPLHEALLHYHPKVAQYLISKGAAIDFFAAAGLGKTDIVTRELQRDPVLARAGATSASPLHFAVAGNQKAIADDLLKAGADVNAEAPALGGRSPLYLAVLHSQLELVALLIANKASVHALDGYNDTPLHAASTAPIAELLLKNGAETSVFNSGGLTPLHVAAMRNNADVIKVLLTYKADINAQAKLPSQPGLAAMSRQNNNTPLHIAAETGLNQIVQLLASSGADLTLRNSQGLTPLGMALRFEHPDTAEILKRLGAAE